MPRADAVRGRRLRLAAALALLAGGVAVLVQRSESPPAGPVPVAWSRATCARCRMLVSEPRFAAQLQRPDGTVLVFDDPGCLLLHAAEDPAPVHRIYFHHLREDRWIPAEVAAFVPAGPTPMGYGLGAVDAGTPGARDAAAALAHARERERQRERERAGG